MPNVVEETALIKADCLIFNLRKYSKRLAAHTGYKTAFVNALRAKSSSRFIESLPDEKFSRNILQAHSKSQKNIKTARKMFLFILNSA